MSQFPLAGLSAEQASSPMGIPMTSGRMRPSIVLNSAAHPVLMRLLSSVDPKQLGSYISALAELGARAKFFPEGSRQNAVAIAEPPAAAPKQTPVEKQITAPPILETAPPDDDLPDDVLAAFINIKRP